MTVHPCKGSDNKFLFARLQVAANSDQRQTSEQAMTLLESRVRRVSQSTALSLHSEFHYPRVCTNLQLFVVRRDLFELSWTPCCLMPYIHTIHRPKVLRSLWWDFHPWLLLFRQEEAFLIWPSLIWELGNLWLGRFLENWILEKESPEMKALS